MVPKTARSNYLAPSMFSIDIDFNCSILSSGTGEGLNPQPLNVPVSTEDDLSF